MTRTYRMYVDSGISNDLLNYIRNDIPATTEHGSRITITRFARGSEVSFFEFDYIVDYGPGALITEEFGTESYFSAHINHLRDLVLNYQVRYDLIFDSENP
jgi:hypothetical protein